jgi:hypothetical protein
VPSTRAFGLRKLLCITGAQYHHIRVGPVLRIAIATPRLLWRSRRVAMPMSPSRVFERTASANAILSLCHLIEHSCMIEGRARDHDDIADRSQALLTPFGMRSAPEGMRVVQARFIRLGAGCLHPIRAGWRGIDRHTECFRHAVGCDVTVGWPDPAGGED